MARKTRKTMIVAMAACLLAAAALHAAQGLSVKSGARPEKAPAIDITKADDGKTVAVPLGRNARIRLAGNPTTGYSWFLAGIDGNSVAAEGEVTYAPKPRGPGIVGGGGVFELLLRTARAGKSTVRMEYKRPWEKDTPPIEAFRVTVEVKEAKAVKAASAAGALRAPTQPLAQRVREAETVFLGKVVNKAVDGDWARAELLVEEPLSSAEKGAKVAVTWRIKVGTFFIYDVADGTGGVAILKDKHEGRYWLRDDKFEKPEKLAEVKALVTEKPAGTPAEAPIVALKVVPERSVFTGSAWDKPIVIKSNADAAQHFSKDAVKTLETAVDFKKQFVLVFAWRGSGGDELSYNVAESYPEQISFSMKRGMTRDLRPHTRVYALRSNVRWRVQGKAASPATSAAQTIEAKSDDSGEFIRVKADGKYADAKLPIEALEKGEAVEVQVKGKLTDGIMAIGGETTGTTIKARNVTWELDVSGPGLKAKAAKLNGKAVVVTGSVRQKAGVEIAKRTILVVKTLEEG